MRSWGLRIVIVLGAVFLIACLVTGGVEDACTRLHPGAKEFQRTWIWLPAPHWSCVYADGVAEDAWFWKIAS